MSTWIGSRASASSARTSNETPLYSSSARAAAALSVSGLSSLQAGDELFVTELDRLGRSTGEAIVMMDELIRRGVALRVLALPSLRAAWHLLAEQR